MSSQVKLNEFGFYSLIDKPAKEHLKEYYQEKYYQEEKSTYRKSYDEEERTYFYHKIEQKYHHLIDCGLISKDDKYKLIDIGSGEGFTLKFFKNIHWEIMGLDYSDHGCKAINPECANYLIKGDIYKNLEKLIAEQKKFDVIWLDNVLEHVLNPMDLLTRLKKLSSDNGALVIEVPNDFSKIQNYLVENGFVPAEYWIAIPDHISYFNKEGLINICSSAGWKCKSLITDFPIDWFLFNEFSNYKKYKNTGKEGHRARIRIENLLHSISIKKVNSFYKAMGDLGIGRQLIGFFQAEVQ